MAAVIQAAGGVVWRPSAAGGREICLIHRPRRDDWSLPKGRLHAGENPLAAAVREVSEETSVTAVPRVRLPQIRYRADGRLKTVEYWGMRADSVRPFTPNSEVDQVAWMPEAAAAERVCYPHDAQLLRHFMTLPDVTGVVLLVRHTEAVSGDQWRGPDATRPLTALGRAAAAKVGRILALYQPTQLVAASADRCRQSLATLARARHLPVTVEPTWDTAPADPDAAAERLRWHARPGETTVVCSQGEVIRRMLARLTGTSPKAWPTGEGDGWLLPFSGAAPLPPSRLW